MILLILSALIMFSCKKKASKTQVAQTQSGYITCQFVFYDMYYQDSIVSTLTLNGVAKKLKYQHNITDSLRVKSGDVISIQTINYSSMSNYSNNVNISLLHIPVNSSVIVTQTPTPTCTNCVWTSNTSFYDNLQTSYKVIKIQ